LAQDETKDSPSAPRPAPAFGWRRMRLSSVGVAGKLGIKTLAPLRAYLQALDG